MQVNDISLWIVEYLIAAFTSVCQQFPLFEFFFLFSCRAVSAVLWQASSTHTHTFSLHGYLLPSLVLVRGPSGQLQHVAERSIWPFVIGNLLGN